MDNFNNFVPDIGYFIYRKCSPAWEIEKSVIDFHDITYVIAGNGTYYINREPVPVASGDVLYLTPGVLREARSSADDPMELFGLNFKLLSVEDVTNNSKLPLSVKNHIGHDLRVLYLFKQLTRLWLEKKELYHVEARAAALKIIAELIRRVHKKQPAPNMDTRIETVKNYINENFDSRLSLKHLAGLVNLNEVYMGALFKNIEGTTVNEYINRIRINQAANKLMIEKTTITEVAYSCGFSDAFYFCKVFKKYKGFPPSEIGKYEH